MLRVALERLRQGFRTSTYPLQLPVIPDRFRGVPVLDATKCPDGCRECADACPTSAFIPAGPKGLQIDLGRCLFCTDCVEACPEGAIEYKPEYRLATRTRQDLVYDGQQPYPRAQALEEKMLRLFGRSLKMRVVSAGGCGACEADVNVLNTLGFDLSRFGIAVVASPRHADAVLVTGCVTENMRQALKKAYDATPAPKLVIAVGACAISGGPYIDHAEQHNGVDSVVPVDLYIPGCPPQPWTILDGLLRLLGKLEQSPTK